jgi:ABC-2 type transport system ATP-binding protein
MNNAIEVKNLRKEYQDFTLNDISFSLPTGYIMGFVGQNGAGKTTTIRLMLNMTDRAARLVYWVWTICGTSRESSSTLAW